MNLNIGLTVGVVTVVCTVASWAQTDSMQPAPYFTKTAAKVWAEGMYQKGNVDRVLGKIGSEFTLNSAGFESTINAGYVYGEQSGVPLENDGLAALNLTLFPAFEVKGLCFGAAEFSRSRQIDYRWQLGIGPKMTILDDSLHTLKVSVVALFDYTQYTDTTRSGARLSARLKGRHEVVPGVLTFLHETYFQPSLSTFSDLRWQTAMTLEAPISKTFALRTTFRYWHESIVPATRQRDDLQWTAGISATWQ